MTDTDVLQALIDAAIATGTYHVTIPNGDHYISHPLILPRSASNSSSEGIVTLEGETEAHAKIIGTNTFPAGRGLIEWEKRFGSNMGRDLGPVVKNLTLSPAPVDGCMSIFYEYTDANQPRTVSNVVAERMERPSFTNLTFKGDNGFNPAHVYLQGDIMYPEFRNLGANDRRATGGLQNNKYETVLLKTDTQCDTNTPWTESGGIWYGNIDRLVNAGNRGGYSSIFQGKLIHSTISNCFVNGVRGGFDNSYGILLKNSYGVVGMNLGNEGLGDAAQFMLDNVVASNFTNIYPGAADDQGYGKGHGLRMVNGCRQNNVWQFSDKQYLSQAFQTHGHYAIVLDDSCHQNRFFNTRLTVPGDYCFGASDNFIEYSIQPDGNPSIYEAGAI